MQNEAKGARHRQMRKDLRKRQKAQKERKPLCEWDTKRSLKRRVDEDKILIESLRQDVAEAQCISDGWHRSYKKEQRRNYALEAENAALKKLLKSRGQDLTRLDVTDDVLEVSA